METGVSLPRPTPLGVSVASRRNLSLSSDRHYWIVAALDGPSLNGQITFRSSTYNYTHLNNQAERNHWRSRYSP